MLEIVALCKYAHVQYTNCISNLFHSTKLQEQLGQLITVLHFIANAHKQFSSTDCALRSV